MDPLPETDQLKFGWINGKIKLFRWLFSSSPPLSPCHTQMPFSRYLDFIRDTVHQNPAQARLGGQPGTRNLVKGFLKIRRIPQSQLQLLEERTASGLPVWAMVFYCLRCGDLEDAIVVLREVGG